MLEAENEDRGGARGGMEQAAGGEDTRSTVLEERDQQSWRRKNGTAGVMGLPGQHQDQSEVVKARPTPPLLSTQRG